MKSSMENIKTKRSATVKSFSVRPYGIDKPELATLCTLCIVQNGRVPITRTILVSINYGHGSVSHRRRRINQSLADRRTLRATACSPSIDEMFNDIIMRVWKSKHSAAVLHGQQQHHAPVNSANPPRLLLDGIFTVQFEKRRSFALLLQLLLSSSFIVDGRKNANFSAR